MEMQRVYNKVQTTGSFIVLDFSREHLKEWQQFWKKDENKIN